MQTKSAPSARVWCLLLLTALLWGGPLGCKEDEGGLRGSLSDFYDLTYDDVRARLYGDQLSIEYVKENDEVPVRLTLDLQDQLQATSYDLIEQGDITGRARDVDIPRYVTGEITFTRVGMAEGAAIVGTFEARFETGRDEASLAGDFETTLEVIEAVQGYEYVLPDGKHPNYGDLGFAPDGKPLLGDSGTD